MKFFPFSLIALTCSLGGVAQAQNLVLNGNFGDPAVGFDNVEPSNDSINGDQTSTFITDFTVDNGGTTPNGLATDPDGVIQLVGGQYNGNNGFGTYPSGTETIGGTTYNPQIVQLTTGVGDAAGGISQSIATTVGDSYTFTLYYADRYGAGGTGTAYFGDGTPVSLVPTGETFVESAPITIVATSTTTTLDVVQNSTAEPLVIGDLSVVQDALPVLEPRAALPLFGACAAMGLFFWRRRSQLAS